MPIEQEGVLLIVCGPSGVGKTSLSDELLERFDHLTFSTSYTTRPPRDYEVDGEDYHFVDDATFDEMIEAGDFAEWAEVHGNRYGTTFDVIHEAWDDGCDLLFDIDYQGARQLREHFPDSTRVLVIPPDMETLEARLRGRGSEDDESIERRLRNARYELAQYELFEYIVVNDDLDEAVRNLSELYLAARRRFHPRSFVEHLTVVGSREEPPPAAKVVPTHVSHRRKFRAHEVDALLSET